MNTERNERTRSSLCVLVSIQKWIGERRATRAYLCRSVHFPCGGAGPRCRGGRRGPPIPIHARDPAPSGNTAHARSHNLSRRRVETPSSGGILGRRSWIFIFIGTPGGGRRGPGEQGEGDQQARPSVRVASSLALLVGRALYTDALVRVPRPDHRDLGLSTRLTRKQKVLSHVCRVQATGEVGFVERSSGARMVLRLTGVFAR
jgi:hypothetical protein